MRNSHVAFALLVLLLGSGCRDKCRDDPACALVGECKTRGQSCRAGSDTDCRASEGCKVVGECAIVEEEGSQMCGAAQDTDCQPSEVCKRFGLCAAREGYCSANAEGCRQSTACRKHGSCGISQHSCLPGAPADCSSSEDCKLYGLCSLHAASDEAACKARLKKSGRDPMFPTYLRNPGAEKPLVFHSRYLGNGAPENPCHAFCTAGSDDDCARSEGCKKRGLCVAGPADPITEERTCVSKASAPADSTAPSVPPR